VTYFSIFQKNDTHSLPERTEGDLSKHGYKDTRKLRDFYTTEKMAIEKCIELIYARQQCN